MTLTAFAPCLLTLGFLTIVLPFLDRNRTAGRILPCLLCVGLMLRYVVWRLTETLPPFDTTFTALWAYVFLAFELTSVTSGLLFLAFLVRTLDRRDESTANQNWIKAHQPAVDIFIATYNEEEAILDRTILGACTQDYAPVRVFVLDDGKRKWLAELCARRGVHHVTRPDNAHAKAGNMNHALRYVAELGNAADYIVILDADFVVQPNFVRRALALFHDPSVGCVQTPQHFFNPDPLQHGFRSATRWPDEQRFFFDVLLASKDAWGAAFSCGTSSICRRKAVEAIGGFPTESVTEDMLLSIKLRSQGWKTVYLNERLSMGLAPEGLEEYVTQRGRWCLGFMQILRSPWGPCGSANLPLIDRISLVDAFLYWAMTFPFRIVCLLAPIIYALTGAMILYTDGEGILTYAVPTLIAQFAVYPWISRGRCLPILSDASQLLIATTAIKATCIGLFGSRNQKFKVTAKGGDRSRTVVQWGMMRPFAIMLALTIASLIYYVVGNIDYDGSKGWNISWVFWTYYSVIVLIVTCLTCVELPRSAEERFHTSEPIWAQVGEERLPLRLVELWPSGARVRGLPLGGLGDRISLYIEDIGPVVGCVTPGESGEVEVAFDALPGLRDRMLLKLFSGRYRMAPEETSFTDVLRGVAIRMFA
ncbi:glycosyltransferase [Methylobacterium sp. J-090]|uniref:glycosyltransferase family 2 protein n=1 Tax=Methylobacterium sp. J-090 TaxID=2836666 RepID=UPI001FB8D10C|nr:cellulose synthase catalytic subunit [Methylobacterium sp. J-090]MCJ2082088.1 glycosyltransferase [Methylobacterium sp. J-090]